MVIYILGFLVIGYFLFYSTNFLFVYFKLKKANAIVNAKVISKGAPKGSGWRLAIAKVKYEYNNNSYTEFVQHTKFSDYLTEVGSEIELYVDMKNPQICMMKRPFNLISEFLFYVIFLIILSVV